MAFYSPPATATGTMGGGGGGASGVPNFTRLELYYELAKTILTDCQHTESVANLMVDVRFSEIPNAFAKAIVFCVTDDIKVAGLEARFARLMECITFVAFGTTERAAIPCWFFQNYEGFLAACLHKLLVQYATTFMVRPRRGDSAGRHAVLVQARRAFAIAFDLCAGAKNYLSLDCLVRSTKAHAVLAVCNHSRHGFLQSNQATATHLEFMDVLAECILNDPARSDRDVADVETSFGYFAGTRMWRIFAKGCVWWCEGAKCVLRNPATGGENWTLQLEGAVRDAYAALQSECNQSLDAMLSRKRACEDADADADAGADEQAVAPSTPTRVAARFATSFATSARYAHALITPPEKRRAVSTARTANDPAFRKLVEERLGFA
jgi:hypothetical protein